MSSPLALAFDCGTQSMRAILFDKFGNTAGMATVQYPLYSSPKFGWAEQDASVFSEALFGASIRRSLKAMEREEEPELESLTYFSFVHGEILTLRIDERRFNGEKSQTFYTVNARTGEEVSAKEMLEQVGISGEPEQVLNQRVTDLFASRFGPLEGADADYTTALNRTQMALFPVTTKYMHMTEAGRLILALTVYHPTGETTLEEIPLP